jgi:hypothetical protein
MDRHDLNHILISLCKEHININKVTHCEIYEAVFSIVNDQSKSGKFPERASESLKSADVWSVIVV